MPCHIHYIKGPHQSGKTTMALGILERFKCEGVQVAYIAPTQDMARWIRKHRAPTLPCLAGSSLHEIQPGAACRVIVLDDSEMMADLDFWLGHLRQRLELHHGPTQLIVVQTID